MLNVGCGTGLMCRLAAQAGAKHVMGIDLSPESIVVAKALHTHPFLEFETAALSFHKRPL